MKHVIPFRIAFALIFLVENLAGKKDSSKMIKEGEVIILRALPLSKYEVVLENMKKVLKDSGYTGEEGSPVTLLHAFSVVKRSHFNPAIPFSIETYFTVYASPNGELFELFLLLIGEEWALDSHEPTSFPELALYDTPIKEDEISAIKEQVKAGKYNEARHGIMRILGRRRHFRFEA